jgi:DMSO/TMAO reductase YedYZ molybdopterin-dependent catalytic subunit
MKARKSSPFILFLSLFVIGCAATATPNPNPVVTPTVTPVPTPCNPEPVVVPTPAAVPGYAELDPTTGLHMTGTVPDLDFGTYRLEVTGKVDQPLSLTYDELRCLPRVQARPVLNCPGFFQDEATWAGVSLDALLERAGIQDDAERLRLVGGDGYAAIIFLNELQSGEGFIAYEWEGEPLPIIHGFPVRAVFPAHNGNKWVKWLLKIEVS